MKTYWTLSLYVSLAQLEAFYSIFTTEQQDHVKSVEYLRNNFRPLQSLDNREVFKSAVKDAWLPDLTDSLGNPYGTEASKGGSSNIFFYNILNLFSYPTFVYSHSTSHILTLMIQMYVQISPISEHS